MTQSDETRAYLDQLAEEGLSPPSWLSPNYTEPRVNYALQDLVQPGWIAFDVGANFGGISLTMSRLVGPRGIVCAFEANPQIAAKCHRSLIRNGCWNTQLYHAAIYSESGKDVTLYLSDNQVADSIYHKTDRSIDVKTISLDDFAGRLKLQPDIVKMDIEGAEFDALQGFKRTIDFCKPILILEHTPPDSRSMEYMFSKGYVAVDLQNYRRVAGPEDIRDGTVVTDLLYATPERLRGSPYGGDLELVESLVLGPDDFEWEDERHFRSKSLELPPGRYVAALDFSADGNANTMCGVQYDGRGEPIMRAHASSSALVSFARTLVFDSNGSPAHIFFYFLEEPDPTIRINEVTIARVKSFDGGLQLHGLFSS